MNRRLTHTLIAWALLWMGSAGVMQAQTATSTPRIVTVKGKIEGIEAGRLHLVAQRSEQKLDTLGTCTFRAPDFVLKALVPEPMVTQLFVEGYQGGFRLLAEPGTTYEALLKDGAGSYIRGGSLQDELEEHLAWADATRRQIAGLRQQHEELRAQSKYRSASRVGDTLRIVERELHEGTRAFLSRHDDLITAYTYQSNVQMKDAPLEESKRLYDSMGEGARQTHSARLMKERIDRLEKTAGGRIAPDFTLTGLDGKSVTMSKVPAKIKILDFWASWCGPCRMNNPSLKKIYAEYRNKGLEIIGISLDNKQDRWAEATKKDGLSWINVSSLKGWKCEVAQLYNVKAIPAIFILDENNRIIAMNLREEKLHEFLRERL